MPFHPVGVAHLLRFSVKNNCHLFKFRHDADMQKQIEIISKFEGCQHAVVVSNAFAWWPQA